MYASSFKSTDGASDAHYPYKETDFWEPALRKMRGYGNVHSEKFLWPSKNTLKQLDMDQVIKLNGIELGMTSNLFEIRLCFTSGLKSPLMKAETSTQGAEGLNDQRQTFSIDPSKRIAEIFINQN